MLTVLERKGEAAGVVFDFGFEEVFSGEPEAFLETFAVKAFV